MGAGSQLFDERWLLVPRGGDSGSSWRNGSQTHLPRLPKGPGLRYESRRSVPPGRQVEQPVGLP